MYTFWDYKRSDGRVMLACAWIIYYSTQPRRHGFDRQMWIGQYGEETVRAIMRQLGLS
jgi:hypothetical protein